jgi:hypothetical protein
LAALSSVSPVRHWKPHHGHLHLGVINDTDMAAMRTCEMEITTIHYILEMFNDNGYLGGKKNV